MSPSTKHPCSAKLTVSILLLPILALLTAGCTDETLIVGADPYAELLESVGCKEAKAGADVRLAAGQECLEWDLRGGVLDLTHVDAAFNCCPESIDAEVTIDGLSITVFEEESFGAAGPCDCLCLFDLHFAIYDLAPDVYAVSVSGPYSPEPLETTIDLVAQPTGSYCETREVYPWM